MRDDGKWGEGGGGLLVSYLSFHRCSFEAFSRGGWEPNYFNVKLSGNPNSCCRLLAKRPSNTLACLRDGSAQITVLAEKLRHKLQITRCLLTRSQYIDTGPTSPGTDPVMRVAC